MKQLFLTLSMTVAMLGFSQPKITEGIVTSKQTMSSDNEAMNQQLAMIGDMVITTYFKEDKTRTELSSPMTGEVISIFDSKAGQIMMMMNNPVMGKKYVLKPMANTEISPNMVDVKKGSANKVILGYECQQYFVTISQGGTEVSMEMFTTKDIAALNKETLNFGPDYDGGFPLYLEIKTNSQGANFNIKQEVTAITKNTVDDEKFNMTPPTGYEKTDTLPGM